QRAPLRRSFFPRGETSAHAMTASPFRRARNFAQLALSLVCNTGLSSVWRDHHGIHAASDCRLGAYLTILETLGFQGFSHALQKLRVSNLPFLVQIRVVSSTPRLDFGESKPRSQEGSVRWPRPPSEGTPKTNFLSQEKP